MYTIIKNSKDILDLESKLAANNYREYSVDLEGINLSRNGKILNIQLFIIETSEIVIFDCSKLSIAEIKRVLCPIFESSSIAKYMFDCRSDADGLYHQYNIKLAGVVDVQLYEVAFRKCDGLITRYYHGLFKTLLKYAKETGITTQELDIKKKFSNNFMLKKYEIPEKKILTNFTGSF
jgi:hypothetical protein